MFFVRQNQNILLTYHIPGKSAASANWYINDCWLQIRDDWDQTSVKSEFDFWNQLQTFLWNTICLDSIRPNLSKTTCGPVKSWFDY